MKRRCLFLGCLLAVLWVAGGWSEPLRAETEEVGGERPGEPPPSRQVGLDAVFQGAWPDRFSVSGPLPQVDTESAPQAAETPTTEPARQGAPPLEKTVAAARAFLRRRPDIAEKIPQWCGETSPIGILAHWVRITHERNEYFREAMSVLKRLSPADFLALRPDIARSVRQSRGETDPRRAIALWLRYNTTENSIFVDLARWITGRRPWPDAPGQPVPRPPAGQPPSSPPPTGPDTPARPPVAAPPSPPSPPVDPSKRKYDLASLPRPTFDNGWGIHWFPTLGSSREVVDRYLDECEQMGLRWIVFLNEAEKISDANDYLVDRMQAKGMMPILRLYSRTVPLDWAKVRQVVAHYVERGVFYFQIYNEPNLKCEWEDGRIDLPRFLELWEKGATVILEAGGFPAFAPLAPGGEDGRSDIQFFEECLQRMKARGTLPLLKKCWIAIHNQTWHPVDYEADTFSFKKFLFFNRAVVKYLGESRPIIATEGGFQTGGNAAMNDRHCAYNLDYYRYMLRAEPYFLAQCSWILGNDVGGGAPGMWEDATWFKPSGAMPIVEALKREPKRPR